MKKFSELKILSAGKLCLFLIVFLAAILRFWQIEGIPPGLNRDEASIGYTAYSILKTGKDEYGETLPISLKSFGDWKLPAYPYLTIPTVAAFGLTEFTVRFPSALFGTLTVVVTYFLVKELFPNLSIFYFLFSIFLLSISPWHIFFSRVASEANLAVFLTTVGIWLFFLSFKKLKLFPLSALFLVLPLFTYHGNHIFTPFLVFGLLVFYWKKIVKDRRFWLGSLIFMALFLFILTQTLFSADRTKISGLFPFADPSLVHQKIVLDRIEHQNPVSIASLLFHNKLAFLTNFVAQNYLKSFSPEFLFIQGGTSAQHNIPDFGNLYLWQAPFLAIGLILLLKNKEKNWQFILWWFLISPITASFTRDAPHSARMLPILPLPEIITAYGFGKTLELIRIYLPKFAIPLGLFLSFLLFGNFLLWFDRYFVHFPYKMAFAWGDAYKRVVEKVTPIQINYKEVVMARPDYSPYIYFAFYQKIDPKKLATEAKRYPPTLEGFHHVSRLGNLVFRKIDWADDLLIPGRLYIDWVESIPPGATQSGVLITAKDIARLVSQGRDTSDLRPGMTVTSRLIDTVWLPDGKPQFYLIEIR